MAAVAFWRGNVTARDVEYLASPGWFACDVSGARKGEKVVLFLEEDPDTKHLKIAHFGRGRMVVKGDEAASHEVTGIPAKVSPAALKSAIDAPVPRKCPYPVTESQLWAVHDGVIQDTSGGDTLIVRTKERPITVRLAGVYPAASSDAAAFLRTFIGRRVEIQITQMLIIDNGPLYGVARVDGIDLVNQMLLEGVVSYAEPPAYALTASVACGYRKAEAMGRGR